MDFVKQAKEMIKEDALKNNNAKNYGEYIEELKDIDDDEDIEDVNANEPDDELDNEPDNEPDDESDEDEIIIKDSSIIKDVGNIIPDCVSKMLKNDTNIVIVTPACMFTLQNAEIALGERHCTLIMDEGENNFILFPSSNVNVYSKSNKEESESNDVEIDIFCGIYTGVQFDYGAKKFLVFLKIKD